MDLRALSGSKKQYLGNREGMLAFNLPRAIAASALRIHPMKTVFVAVTVATIRCRQYVENQEVDHVDAVVAWEWRMLNSLAILTWLKTFLINQPQTQRGCERA